MSPHTLQCFPVVGNQTRACRAHAGLFNSGSTFLAILCCDIRRPHDELLRLLNISGGLLRGQAEHPMSPLRIRSTTMLPPALTLEPLVIGFKQHDWFCLCLVNQLRPPASPLNLCSDTYNLQ